MIYFGEDEPINQRSFSKDMANEVILGEFLDKYFYCRTSIENFQRYNMKSQEQYDGIDVCFEKNNQVYLVDEKGYLTKPTIQNTFVLELSTLNPNDVRKEGWFYDPSKKTTHYLMCWAERDTIDIYKVNLTIDHLHKVELMLVNREKLQGYLQEKYAINREYICEVHEKLLEETAKGAVYLPNSKSRYNFSYKLTEKPLNIVMTKQEYIESGAVEARYTVERDGIKKL